MARATSNGSAQSVSAKDFNERVKRLLAEKPDTQPKKTEPAQRRQKWKPGGA